MSCRAELESSPSPPLPSHSQASLASNLEPEPEYDFVEEPDQDHFCPVSLELLTEPYQTSCCGHHISRAAAERLIRDRKCCPMCKQEGFTVLEDKYFKRTVINTLKVRCPHTGNGCEWMGELRDLNRHSDSCPKRPWKCQYCGFESTFDLGTNHTPNCAQYPVYCPNQCEIVTIPRCDAENHLLVCPLQLVECKYAYIGCEEKICRRDLARHMTENTQHHLMSATLHNLRLTRELRQKMEEKDQQIAELKQQLNEHEVKMTEQSKEATKKLEQDLDAKLTHQTNAIDTKLKQQTSELDSKLKQQSKDLDTKLTQQTKEMDAKLTHQSKDLDGKLTQQTKEMDAKLTHQSKDLDGKLAQQTKALTASHQQWAKNITAQQTRDMDARLKQQATDLDTKLVLQARAIDAKLQQQTKELHTKFQQQQKEVTTQQTKDIDTKLNAMLGQGAGQVASSLASINVSISHLLRQFVKHEFTLKGFKACRAAGEDGSWDSEQFYTHTKGYKLKLQIDTNGYGSAKDKYLSAHLCLIPGSYDAELQWPLEIKIILEMVNRRRNEGHHVVNESVKFTEAPTKTLFRKLGGSFQFFPLAELGYNADKDTEFLKDDSLRFNLYLKIVFA